jgi:hypothetical protein
VTHRHLNRKRVLNHLHLQKKIYRNCRWFCTIALLALAMFGGAAQIGLFLSLSHCPRCPRQVQVCHCHLSLLRALRITYIGEVCKQNRERQRHETVLALATLGDMTRNRNNAICVSLPKVANASKFWLSLLPELSHNLCQCKYGFIPLTFANVKMVTSHVRFYSLIVHWICLGS